MASDGRFPAPICVLAIGGVDPSGGAGLAADARTVGACGGFARLVPACLTVQTSRAFVRAEPVRRDLFLAMLDAAVSEGPVAAIKIGLLPEPGLVEALAEWLVVRTLRRVPVVLDPVLGASAGGLTLPPRQLAALRDVLLPLASVVTPNLPELAMLAGAAGIVGLLARGVAAVVAKGGHGEGPESVDRWCDRDGELVAKHPRLPVGKVRGTGCAFAAALATALGARLTGRAAFAFASEYVHEALRATTPGVDGAAVPLAVPALSLRQRPW